jgi:hypothetical protein
MKTCIACLVLLAGVVSIRADEISLQSAPPVVIKTVPVAGSTSVDPGLTELRVTFSKPMQNGSWSWTTFGEDSFPEITGKIRYLEDGRTCVAPVKLEPGKFYTTWLNSDNYQNFKDTNGTPAVPYLLTFKTAGAKAEVESKSTAMGASTDESANDTFLSEQQRLVLQWTERQFRSFFDRRTFEGLSEKERADLETKLLDTLKGPHTREYYQALCSLAALRSQKAVQPLLAIAADRAEKDNRDRWMAIRSLGIIGDKTVVPELIHLTYHGNINTRWWAQISLVRLTGKNFGYDWKAWGQWWNAQGGQPAFKEDFVTWYKDDAWSDPAKLPQTLAQADEKFFADLKK